MKAILSAFVLLTFIGLFYIGCSDKSTTSVESNDVTLQKESSGSGAGILRYEAENAYGFIDTEAQLMLVLGINDFPAFCSDGGGMDWFKFKELLLPNADPELRRLIMQITAKDVTAIIWQTDTWPEDFCDFVLNNQPLAMGTANFKYTDNDFYAWWQGNHNSNPFGYKANGSLESLNGQEYNLNFFDRVNWDGIGLRFKENVKIHLVPKGN